MGDWRPLLQVPLTLVVTSLAIIMTYDLPQGDGQSFFPSRQQCLRFPRSSFLCSFFPVPIHYGRPPPHSGFHARRPPHVRRPSAPFNRRGRPQRQPPLRPVPMQSAEESVESQPVNTDPNIPNADLINPLRRRPHPMGMEMEHLLSLPPVTFTKEEELPSQTKKSKKRPAKVKWRISETNTIEKEMNHLSQLMAWQPKSRSSTPRPTPSTTTTKAPSSTTSERPNPIPSAMSLSDPPKMHKKKRPGSSWMKETMEEMPTVMKTIPLMTTFAKAALILNRKSKQDEEQQQQKQQQEFNNNRPSFFSYTDAFLLYSKDAMGPVRTSERKKPKKNKRNKDKQKLPELTKEEMLEEERRKKEQEKSDKIRKSIERLHLTRAIIGVVSDSLNLASNKINLINTVAGSSLIGGGNNNPGGGGGGGGGILNAAKQKVKLHGQKFTSLIKAATSAGAAGTGIISGILGKNPILQLPSQARTNLTDVVDSYATLVTREAIHNATISEL